MILIIQNFFSFRKSSKNCSISVQLRFDGALPAIPFLGERISTFYVNSKQKLTKHTIITSWQMDSDEIRLLLGKCLQLKVFQVVFAADNIPKLTREGFIIVNASPSHHAGSHWMAHLFQENKVCLANPLGIRIKNYQLLYCRLVKFYHEVTQILKFKPIQNHNSKLCGLFCIYFAHVIFRYEYPLMMNMNNNDLLRVANHML